VSDNAGEGCLGSESWAALQGKRSRARMIVTQARSGVLRVPAPKAQGSPPQISFIWNSNKALGRLAVGKPELSLRCWKRFQGDKNQRSAFLTSLGFWNGPIEPHNLPESLLSLMTLKEFLERTSRVSQPPGKLAQPHDINKLRKTLPLTTSKSCDEKFSAAAYSMRSDDCSHTASDASS
jgi:hypothetical protein